MDYLKAPRGLGTTQDRLDFCRSLGKLPKMRLDKIQEFFNQLTRKLPIGSYDFSEFVSRVRPDAYNLFIKTIAIKRDRRIEDGRMEYYLKKYLKGELKICSGCNNDISLRGDHCQRCSVKRSRNSTIEDIDTNKIKTDKDFIAYLYAIRNVEKPKDWNVWLLYKTMLPCNYLKMQKYFSSLPTKPVQNTKHNKILREYLEGNRFICAVCGLGNYTRNTHRTCHSEDHNKKVADTLTEKYGGVGYASKVIGEKIRSTMVERHGVKYTIQNENLNKKRLDTLLKNYGVTNALMTPKAIEGRANVDYDLHRPKYEATMLANYGEGWQVRMGLVMKQARYKHTSVTLPGATLNLQGYEPQVARFLVLKFSGIKFSKNEKFIPYWCPSKLKTRHYVPDFICKMPNDKIRVIEVKSTYTAGLDSGFQSYWQILKAKAKGTLDATGVPLDLIIYVPGREPFIFTDVSSRWTRNQIIKATR